MGTEHHYFSSPDGEIRGHIAIATIDATFKYGKKKVNMYFHRYLGPSFYLVDDGREVDIYPGFEDDYKHLWRQFDGWWGAKGKAIYKD